MKIDSLNINEFIKTGAKKKTGYEPQEVTNPIYFNVGGVPTNDGIFSTLLFGNPGSDSRKKTFGYVDLHRRFIHPVAFDLFKKLSSALVDIVLCKKYYTVNSMGELILDEEHGETGIDFLYRNINKIRIKDTGTTTRARRMSLLENLSMNDIFIDKFPICPPFYRDYNPSKSSSGNGGMKVDEINKYYVKLIQLSKTVRQDDEGYSFSGNITQANIQLCLNDIYDFYIRGKLSKKTGHIHQALLGHTVDYSTRGVITAETYTSKSHKDSQIPFGSTGIPLTMVVVLFKGFFVKWIQDFILQHEPDIKITLLGNTMNKGNSSKSNKDVTGEIDLKELFDEKLITRLLSLFIESEESRFQILSVTDNKGNVYEIHVLEEQLHRVFTLTDLMFLAADDIVQNKHVVVTRFPVEKYQSVYPSRIKVVSTKETVTMKIDDKYFVNYPQIIPNYPETDMLLIQSIVMCAMYLDSLGGDHDGKRNKKYPIFRILL